MAELPKALEQWHAIIASRDVSGLRSLLADDVVLHSPIVHTPQISKAATLPYLQAAFHVFLNDTFKYVREVVGETDAILEFVVEVDGIVVNGVDMIKWDADDCICDFKVMIRPLKAMNLIHQKMGEMLATTRLGAASTDRNQH
jgi:hypothetical protein